MVSRKKKYAWNIDKKSYKKKGLVREKVYVTFLRANIFYLSLQFNIFYQSIIIENYSHTHLKATHLYSLQPYLLPKLQIRYPSTF